jgi:hypothetical protein
MPVPVPVPVPGALSGPLITASAIRRFRMPEKQKQPRLTSANPIDRCNCAACIGTVYCTSTGRQAASSVASSAVRPTYAACGQGLPLGRISMAPRALRTARAPFYSTSRARQLNSVLDPALLRWERSEVAKGKTLHHTACALTRLDAV